MQSEEDNVYSRFDEVLNLLKDFHEDFLNFKQKFDVELNEPGRTTVVIPSGETLEIKASERERSTNKNRYKRYAIVGGKHARI